MKVVHGRPPVITDGDEVALMNTLAEVAEMEETWEDAAFYWNQYAKALASKGRATEAHQAFLRVAYCQRKFMEFSLTIDHFASHGAITMREITK